MMEACKAMRVMHHSKMVEACKTERVLHRSKMMEAASVNQRESFTVVKF